MSVSEVKLLSTGAGGGVEGTNSGAVRVSYTSTYQVKCSSNTDDPTIVLNYFRTHTSLPWPGRTYRFSNGFDTSAICRTVSPSYIENSDGIYTVSCAFKDRDDDGQQKESNATANGTVSEDPTQWLPEIEVSSGSFSVPVEFATFVGAKNASKLSAFLKPGKFLPITNSALEPLDPTFEEEFSYKVIRFTKNLKSYDDSFYNTYNDAINKSEVTINLPKLKFRTVVAKHYGKLKVAASLGYTNSVMYWRRTVELHIRGWDRAILDQGTKELYTIADATGPDGSALSAGNFPRGRISLEHPLTDNDGLPIDKPRLLDGNGKRLKEGQPPVSLGWQTFHEADFSKIDW